MNIAPKLTPQCTADVFGDRAQSDIIEVVETDHDIAGCSLFLTSPFILFIVILAAIWEA